MKATLLFLLLSVALLRAPSALWAQTVEHPPNFVVILGEGAGWNSTSVPMDDTVPDSKSDLLQTPNLARLASEGVRFSHFYAASPRCTPSRAAILTGKSPAQLHMTFINGGRRRDGDTDPGAGLKWIAPTALMELPAGELTIGDVLKPAGYATAHFGKWHVGRVSPRQHGFDESDGPTGNEGPDRIENPNPGEAFAMTDRGLAFMDRQAKTGTPFYLQISHYPGRRGEADSRPETYAAVRRRAGAENARQVASAAILEDMDAAIGAVLKKIDELGIANNTYVLYTTDHGAQGRNANRPLSGGKSTLLEGGIRVPFILRGPGIKAGTYSHVPATDVDLLPTIAALARLKTPLPASIEGGSLLPALAGGGPVKRPRGELFFHFPHYDEGNDGPVSAVIVGREKLLRNYETGELHLYDLAKDAGETHDLSKENPHEAAALNQRLTEYLKAVNAQMPAPNPIFDPAKAAPVPDRRGGRKMGDAP